ncbi:MAG: hypothetical protein LBH58_04735, partial [Tannerellaceae bacterium]|nr:hypothetical protein [Tannerellaceae bacterium]
MKKITISLLSLLISAFLVAQPRNAKAQEVTSQYLHWEYIEKGAILDSAKLRIVYSLDYMPDSLKPEQILKDRKILLIGDKLGYFYSYYIYLGDSAYTTGSNQPIFPAGLQGEGARIYTSSAAKERTVIEPITMLSTYRYQENIEEFQWNISTDT